MMMFMFNYDIIPIFRLNKTFNFKTEDAQRTDKYTSTAESRKNYMYHLKMKFGIIPFSKFASAKEIKGETEGKTAVYKDAHDDLSTLSTHNLPAEVEFQKKSIRKKFNIHSILIIIILLALGGCLNKTDCYEADDFGLFSYASISADSNIKTLKPLQFSKWKRLDAGFVSGGKLIITLQKESNSYTSSWTSWYGISTLNNTVVETPLQIINDVVNNLIPKSPNKTDFADNLKYANNICQTVGSEFEIANAPCVINNGIGLYVTTFQNDPTTLAEIELPETLNGSPALHLGTNSPTTTGQDVILYNDYPPSQWVGKKLYFRFLDTYYQDNLGGYSLVVKSGLTRASFDPIAFVIKKVREVVLNTVEAVYKSLTKDKKFQTIVKVSMLLFVVIYSFMFIMGMVRMTAGELAIKGLKVGIITIAISDSSWEFYNKVLFKLFTDGTGDLISIISGSRGSAEGIFIDILSIVWNFVVPQKILAIMFASGLGFGIAILFFIVFIIVFIFITLAIFKAVATYVTALLMISFMVTLFPIFIVSILFQWTMNKLFNEWVKIIAANAIQAFIVIAIYIFFKDIVISQFQKVIGFRACWQVVEATKDFFPISIIRPSISHTRAQIAVPGTFYDLNGNLCPAYGCTEERYIDIPFLKPGDLYNNNMMTVVGNKFQIMSMADAFRELLVGNDQPVIDSFLIYNSPRAKDVAMLLAIVYCFYTLTSYATSMAKFISGQSFSWGGQNTAADIGEQMGGKPLALVTSMPAQLTGLAGKGLGKLAYKIEKGIQGQTSSGQTPHIHNHQIYNNMSAQNPSGGQQTNTVLNTIGSTIASNVKKGAKKIRDLLKDL